MMIRAVRASATHSSSSPEADTAAETVTVPLGVAQDRLRCRRPVGDRPTQGDGSAEGEDAGGGQGVMHPAHRGHDDGDLIAAADDRHPRQDRATQTQEHGGFPTDRLEPVQ